MKEYEIWIGKVYGDMDSLSSTEPRLIGKEKGIDFPTACLKHELRSMLYSIEKQELEGYVQEQSKEWFYNWRENSTSWLGKFYPSREEALKSFE